MKILAAALPVIVLLGIALPAVTTLALPSRTPHENPATATSSPDRAVLLLAYNQVLNLATSRKYQDALDALNELTQADLPAEISDTIGRFGDLSRKTLDNLYSAELLLAEASSFFSRDRNIDAHKKLEEAEVAIQEAGSRLEEMVTATKALADNLGVFAVPATSRMRQVYDRLNGSLNQVRQLTNELEQLRKRLAENPQPAMDNRFYPSTSLELSAPGTAYPGLPITVSGQVISAGSNAARTIRILLDDTRLAEETVTGRFSLGVTTPAQAGTGKHELTVVVTPQESYPGTYETRIINISTLPIYISTRAPGLAVLTQTIQISGLVYHERVPVPSARVSLDFRGTSTTATTASDGGFTISLEAPLSLSLMGPQEVTIIIEPVEPWYASSMIERQIFLINPLSTGLLMGILIVIGRLAYRRGQASRREDTGSPRAPPREVPAFNPAPAPGPGFSAVKGRILSAYRSALEAVEKLSGAGMAPNVTLREYLKATMLSPANAERFAELTVIAEITLYAARSPGEGTAARAEALAATIEEEPRRGTP